MKIRILVAGKPALEYARLGCEEYLRRLERFGSYGMEHVKAGTPEKVSAELARRSEGSLRIALDQRGEPLGTETWAERLAAFELRGDVKAVSFLIGAADGHTADFRRQCDQVWSLSPLTLQHELALVVLLEQLYRIANFRSGGPYHR